MDCAVEDKREAKSLAAIADKLPEHPELAFSSAVGKNLRQAAWRIFSKEDADISCGHYRQTARRCEEHPLVLVSHDTADLNFAGHHACQGLGDPGGAGSIPGMCLHSALALTFDTFQRLCQAIAMLSIVAWQLLLLKQLAAHVPKWTQKKCLKLRNWKCSKKGRKQISLHYDRHCL